MSQSNDHFNNLTDSDSEGPTMAKKVRYDANKEILKKISKLEASQQNLINLLSRLTDEVMTIKREVKKLVEKSEVSKVNILPPLPFSTSETFLKFDEQIKEPNNSKLLVSNLMRKVSANCAKDFAFKCWRLIISDNAAKEFNWSGQNNKICASKLACTAALQEAFLTKYPDQLEVYTQKTKKYFTYANDRLNKNEKYKTTKS